MNILIIYGSLTGNNEIFANKIQSYIQDNYPNVTNIEVISGYDAHPDMFDKYDFLFIGSSTWGDGDLVDPMFDLVDDIEKAELSGIKIAVFANGMIEFPQFCKAGDTIKEVLEKAGAEIVGEVIKVNGDIDSASDDITTWTKGIMDSIS